MFLGELIYEGWNFLLVFGLCSVIIILIGKSFYGLLWKIQIEDLIIPVIAVMIQIHIYGFLPKLFYLLTVGTIYIFIKRRKRKDSFWFNLFSICICLTIGMGYNILPLVLSILIFLIARFNKKTIT